MKKKSKNKWQIVNHTNIDHYCPVMALMDNEDNTSTHLQAGGTLLPPPSSSCVFLHSSGPGLRLSVHCVMSLLCKSEALVWQPNCNATPLTWESQQSVVLVRETFHGAGLFQNPNKLYSKMEPKKKNESRTICKDQQIALELDMLHFTADYNTA